jgi:CheY-like chemotaxis protein
MYQPARLAVDTCRRRATTDGRAGGRTATHTGGTRPLSGGTLSASSVDVAIDTRVLVADDDAEMLAAVSDALTGLGFDVVGVDSGAGLIDRLAFDGPFDLIVTDVSMPWMDGLRTLRSIRSAGVTTPVIVMTALGDEQIAARVQALANAILLRKPFDLDALSSAAVGLMAPRAAGAAPPQ